MTSRGKVRVSIKSGDDFATDLKHSLTQALKSSRRDLRFLMEQEAKAKIREEGAIWLGRLMSSFEHTYERRGNRLVLILKNTSGHASYVEYGAEYGAVGPPVAPLIPWVQYHLSGYSIPSDAGPYPTGSEVSGDDRIMTSPDGGSIDAFEGVSDEVVQKAFWLQESIKENGLDAVGFMDQAEDWARKNGHKIVAENVESHI